MESDVLEFFGIQVLTFIDPVTLKATTRYEPSFIVIKKVRYPLICDDPATIASLKRLYKNARGKTFPLHRRTFGRSHAPR